MDISKRQCAKYITAGITATLAAISMIIFPGIVLNSARQGIALWANTVLPALLPFFICADFMIALGLPAIVGSFFENAFQKIFRTSGSAAFVFIVSITSGYPIGARIIGRMKERGEITDKEGIRMLSFCSTSGPLFMLGAVGAGMLGSTAAGIVIALSHYSAALANGLLFRILNRKAEVNATKSVNHFKYANLAEKSILEILTDSILSSLKTLGIICCYIVIFVYVTDLVEMTGCLNIAGGFSSGFFKGLIEMTVGLYEISLIGTVGLRLKCTVAAFLISFGGISIMAQSLSVIGGLKITPFHYTFMKLCHGFLAAAIAYFIAPLILNRAVIGVFFIEYVQDGYNLGFLMQLLFSIKMIIIVVSIFLFTVILELLLSVGKETAD